MRRLNSTFGNRSKKNKVPIYLVGMGNLGRLELEFVGKKVGKIVVRGVGRLRRFERK